MANYAGLLADINAKIKMNGRKEITGDLLNSVLRNMVANLGEGYRFVGVATPETQPGAPDQKLFYVASTAGNYDLFGVELEEGEVAFLTYDTSWHKVSTTLASKADIEAVVLAINNIAGLVAQVLVDLANKVDKTEYEAAVAQLTASLATKASNDRVASLEGVVATKAGKTYVDTELAKKVNQAAYDLKVAAIEATLATRASQADLNTTNTNLANLTNVVAEHRILSVDCEEYIKNYCSSIDELAQKYTMINITWLDEGVRRMISTILPSTDTEQGWLYEYCEGWRLCKTIGFVVDNGTQFIDLASFFDAHSTRIVTRTLTGELSHLATADKSNLVAAINELRNNIISSINADY